jgi:hypothetical protein
MKKLILAGLVMTFSFTIMAQKGKVLEGDWKALSGIEKFDLEFDYSNVEIPDFDTEQDYIDQKMKEKDDDKAGDGNIWRERYFEDRQEHYEPKFMESFNKRGAWQSSKDFDDALYVLKVETTLHYHGWNVGVMRKAARLDAVISVFKRGENTPLLKTKYENVKGGDALGYDFAIHSRVAEGYAKLAKSFLSDLKKKS